MTESEQRETWKSLIDMFYDTEALEIRPGCDELFDDKLSLEIAICARLANIGLEEDALRLWNHITAKQNSPQSGNHCRLNNRTTGEAEVGVNRADVNQTDANISPVALSPAGANRSKRNHISSEEGGQAGLVSPADGAVDRED